MRKTATILMVTGLAIACAGAGAAASGMARLHFKTAGFSIKPLEPTDNRQSYLAVQMYLPASAGFAPNVNVEVQQPYNGNIQDYIALSKRQLKLHGWTIIRFTKVDRRSATFEYSGRMKGRMLHFYARAILSGHKAYLATGGASVGQWKKDKAPLVACVNSLAVDKAHR